MSPVEQWGKYNSKDFDQLLKRNGTVQRLTVQQDPEQNGIAERKNR